MTLPLFGPMTLSGFAHPWFFLFLLVIAGLVGLYVVVQFARQKRILRFANMELLESGAPQRPNRWRHLPASLLIGSLACGLVRFGEVIFWLSNLDYDIPVALPERYVLAGVLATGLAFALTPWPRRPVRLPRRSPQILFADRY